MAKGKRKAGPEVIVNIYGSTSKGRANKRARYVRFSPPPLDPKRPTAPPTSLSEPTTIDLSAFAPDDGDPTWVTEAAVDVHDMGEPTDPQAPRSRRSAGKKKKTGVAVRRYL